MGKNGFQSGLCMLTDLIAQEVMLTGVRFKLVKSYMHNPVTTYCSDPTCVCVCVGGGGGELYAQLFCLISQFWLIGIFVVESCE